MAEAEGDRAVLEIVEPQEVLEGAGVIVRRALPSPTIPYEAVDPFLLLDHFDASRGPARGTAFPKHPHRGFEIITYVLRGGARHADDFGNASVVAAGGLQRITAGRGMWHEEGPAPGAQEPMVGLQLWVNLARRDKGLPPEYQAVPPEALPLADRDGARVKVLVGDGSPVRLRTPVLYLDIVLPPGGAFSWPLPEGFHGFAYLLEGRGRFGDAAEAVDGQLLLLGPRGRFRAWAGPRPLRFLLAAGRPHGEPIHWRGPFVD